MKTIKNEVVGLFVITALMPVLIPTYLAYHLLFKEQDFVKKEQKTKKKSNIVEDTKRNYYDKWHFLILSFLIFMILFYKNIGVYYEN